MAMYDDFLRKFYADGGVADDTFSDPSGSGFTFQPDDTQREMQALPPVQRDPQQTALLRDQADAIEAKNRDNYLQGVSYFPERFAGAPGDIAGLIGGAARWAAGKPQNEGPEIGGSDWMLQKEREYGLRAPSTGTTEEERGDILGSFIDPTSGIAHAGALAAKGVAAAGHAIPAAKMAIFAGAAAKTADLGLLARAKEMEVAGEAPEAIHAATGWFKGASGDWMFEIDDSKSGFNHKSGPEALAPVGDGVGGPNVRAGATGEVFDHPDAYAAYPELAGRRMELDPDIHGGGFYPDGTTRVGIAHKDYEAKDIGEALDTYGPGAINGMSEDGRGGSARGVTLHEMQHAIQAIEGWSPGANPLSPEVLKAIPALRARATELLAENDQKWDAVNRMFQSPEPDVHNGAHAALAEAREERGPLVRFLKATEEGPKVNGNGYSYRALLEGYRHNEGEAMARNVQTRMDMTPEERKASLPTSTEDTRRDMQWTGKGDGTAASVPDDETVRLYHGTSPEGLAGIESEGSIKGPVFLSPRKDVATDYSGSGHVVPVDVPKSQLKVDFDLPNGRLLSVEEANGYSGHEGWTIDDYLRHGQSVGTDGPVAVGGRGELPKLSVPDDEHIVGPAWSHNGKVYGDGSATSHTDALWDDIIDKGHLSDEQADHEMGHERLVPGYRTSTGRFVDEKEAYDIATKNGQFKEVGNLGLDGHLTSENLIGRYHNPDAIQPSTKAPSPAEIAAARADTRVGGDIVGKRLDAIVPEHTRVLNGEYTPGLPEGQNVDGMREGDKWQDLPDSFLKSRGPGFKTSDEELHKLWQEAVNESSQAAKNAVEKHGVTPKFLAKAWDKAMQVPWRDILWYELSGEKFHTGLPDLTPQEHRQLMDLVGATSARAEPGENLERALGVLSQNMRKVPADVDLTIPSTVRDAIARKGEGSSALAGNKTGHFSDTLTLTGGVPTRFPISVNDVWVGKMFGIPDEVMSANQSLHEPMALYFNKLRDLYNARMHPDIPLQSWNFQAPAWVHLRNEEAGANSGDAYHQVWDSIVNKLQKAGVPGVKDGVISREALMDPRFADALRARTPEWRAAPKATVEFGTTQTNSGLAAHDLYKEAMQRGDTKSEGEYLKGLTTAMYQSARGQHPWDMLKKAITGDLTGKSDITRIMHPTSEAPLDIGGTFEGAVSPNIRIPLKGMTDAQQRYFNAVAGKHLKQDAMAVSRFHEAEPGSAPREGTVRTHSVFAPTTEQLPPEAIRAFAQELNGHGHDMSYARHPNGYQFDVLPNFSGDAPVGIAPADLKEAYNASLGKHVPDAPTVVSHDFQSVYTPAAEYGAARRQLVEEIRRDFISQAVKSGADKAQAAAAAKGGSLPAGFPRGSQKAWDTFRGRLDHLSRAEEGFKGLAKRVDESNASFIERAQKRYIKADRPERALGGRVGFSVGGVADYVEEQYGYDRDLSPEGLHDSGASDRYLYPNYRSQAETRATRYDLRGESALQGTDLGPVHFNSFDPKGNNKRTPGRPAFSLGGADRDDPGGGSDWSPAMAAMDRNSGGLYSYSDPGSAFDPHAYQPGTGTYFGGSVYQGSLNPDAKSMSEFLGFAQPGMTNAQVSQAAYNGGMGSAPTDSGPAGGAPSSPQAPKSLAQLTGGVLGGRGILGNAQPRSTQVAAADPRADMPGTKAHTVEGGVPDESAGVMAADEPGFQEPGTGNALDWGAPGMPEITIGGMGPGSNLTRGSGLGEQYGPGTADDGTALGKTDTAGFGLSGVYGGGYEQKGVPDRSYDVGSAPAYGGPMGTQYGNQSMAEMTGGYGAQQPSGPQSYGQGVAELGDIGGRGLGLGGWSSPEAGGGSGQTGYDSGPNPGSMADSFGGGGSGGFRDWGGYGNDGVSASPAESVASTGYQGQSDLEAEQGDQGEPGDDSAAPITTGYATTGYGISPGFRRDVVSTKAPSWSDPQWGLRQSFIDKMVNQYGWSPKRAEAYAGSLVQESNAFTPNKYSIDDAGVAHHKGSYNGAMTLGDYGDQVPAGQPSAFGAFQDRLARANGLAQFMGIGSSFRDLNRSNLEGTLNKQYDYMAQVDEPKRRAEFPQLGRLDDMSLPEATNTVSRFYESPDPNKAGNENRQRNAQIAANQWGASPSLPGDVVPTNVAGPGPAMGAGTIRQSFRAPSTDYGTVGSAPAFNPSLEPSSFTGSPVSPAGPVAVDRWSREHQAQVARNGFQPANTFDTPAPMDPREAYARSIGRAPAAPASDFVSDQPIGDYGFSGLDPSGAPGMSQLLDRLETRYAATPPGSTSPMVEADRPGWQTAMERVGTERQAAPEPSIQAAPGDVVTPNLSELRRDPFAGMEPPDTTSTPPAAASAYAPPGFRPGVQDQIQAPSYADLTNPEDPMAPASYAAPPAPSRLPEFAIQPGATVEPGTEQLEGSAAAKGTPAQKKAVDEAEKVVAEKMGMTHAEAVAARRAAGLPAGYMIDPITREVITPRFSQTPAGKIAMVGLTVVTGILSPPAGLGMGAASLTGKSPLQLGMDKLANNLGWDPEDNSFSGPNGFGGSGLSGGYAGNGGLPGGYGGNSASSDVGMRLPVAAQATSTQGLPSSTDNHDGPDDDWWYHPPASDKRAKWQRFFDNRWHPGLQ
jgi:hypothetical protein